MVVNGGIVTKAVRYPAHLKSGIVFAVQGYWSGGTWSPGSNTVVHHYRQGNLIDIWKMVGVNIRSGPDTDAVLLLEAVDEPSDFQTRDILVFGEGRYSELALETLSLQARLPREVQVGPNRYNALALPHNSLLVFHENDSTLPNQLVQEVWDGQTRYNAVLKESFTRSDGYYLEFYLNHSDVTLKRLLDTLIPIRQFTLDAGQELLYLSPAATGQNRFRGTYRTFEPIITVEPGSVRILIHPARPAQMPLFVKPDEPLRVMEDVFRAAAEGIEEQVAALLGSRFYSGDVFMKRLKAIADTAAKHGEIVIRNPETDRQITVDANASRTFERSIDILPLRMEERVGTIAGIEISRGWLRLYYEDEDKKEEWTLSFPKHMQEQLHGHIPRKASVLFETRTLAGLSRGRGKLISIRNID